MRKITKRTIGIVLSLTMVLSLALGLNVFADTGSMTDWNRGYYKSNYAISDHYWTADKTDCTAEIECETNHWGGWMDCKEKHQFFTSHDFPERTTCEEETVKCTRCNAKMTYPAQHYYTEVIETVDPTCLEDGYTTYKCEFCGLAEKDAEGKNVKRDIESALGHDYTVEDVVVDPTCIAHGYTYYKCEFCGLAEKDENGNRIERDVVPATGHDFPARTRCSEETVVCENCNGTLEGGTRTYEAQDHTYRNGDCEQHNNTNHFVYCDLCHRAAIEEAHTFGSATKFDCQTHKKVCSKCGQVVYEAHDWQGNNCKICDAKKNNDAIHNYVFDPEGEITYGGHTLKCTGCNNTKYEAHVGIRHYEGIEALFRDDKDGDCSVCGVHQYVNNNCTHRYIINTKDCTQEVLCLAVGDGCGEPDKKYNREFHEFEYSNITGTTHDKACKYCTIEKVTEEHVYDQANGTKCVCGKEKPACEHTYTYTDNKNGTHHYVCSKCGAYGDANHTYGEWNVTTPSTCSTLGKRRRVCTADGCGAFEEEDLTEFAAHVHTTWNVKTPATCEEAGEEINVCDVCKGDAQTRPITKLGHNYSQVDVVVDPTCIAHGYTYYKCANCGLVEKDENGNRVEKDIKTALGHDLINVEKEDSTCLEPGHEAGHTCSRCDYKDGLEVIKAKGHTWGEWSVTTPSTCTELGKRRRVCTADGCGAFEEEDLTEFAAHVHTTWNVKTPATCEEAGEEINVCDVCNGDAQTRPITKLGHDWDNGYVTSEPTCIAPGNKFYTCQRCNGTKNEPIEIDPDHHVNTSKYVDETTRIASTCTKQGSHDEVEKCLDCNKELSRVKVDDVLAPHIPGEEHKEDVVNPTCTEPGSYNLVVRCTVCNGIISSEPGTVNPLGHDWNNGIVTLEPTCIATGKMHYTCQRCNATKDEPIAINSDNHKYGEWSVKVEATCSAEGTERRICEYCSDKDTRKIDIDPNNHKEVEVKGYDSTCHSTGLTDGTKCEWCEKVLKAQEVIPVKEHHLVEDTTAGSTYTYDNYFKHYRNYTLKCDNDGCTHTEPAREEKPCVNEKVRGSEVYVDDSDPGKHIIKITYKCKDCGHEYVDDQKRADHEYGEYTTEIEPTCEEDGLEVRYCTKCQHKDTKPITKTGHDYSVVDVVVQPTCTEHGYTLYKCSKCEEVEKDSQGNRKERDITNALGHSKGEWHTVTKATNDTDGEEAKDCTRCDAKNLETRTINKANLSVDNNEVFYNGEAQAIVAPTLDGVEVVTTITKNGQQVNEAVNAGVYTFTFNYLGNKKYEAFELNATLTIKKAIVPVEWFDDEIKSFGKFVKDYDANNFVYFDVNGTRKTAVEGTITSETTKEEIPYKLAGLYENSKTGDNKKVTLNLYVNTENYELNNVKVETKGDIKVLELTDEFDTITLPEGIINQNDTIANIIEEQLGDKVKTLGTITIDDSYTIDKNHSIDPYSSCENEDSAWLYYTYWKDENKVATKAFSGHVVRVHNTNGEFVVTTKATNENQGEMTKYCTNEGCNTPVGRDVIIPFGASADNKSVNYTGEAQTITPNKDNYQVVIKDSNNEVVTEAVNAGTYTFEFTYEENDKYEEIKISATLTINKAKLVLNDEQLQTIDNLTKDQTKVFDNNEVVFFNGEEAIVVTVKDSNNNDVEIKITGTYNDKFPSSQKFVTINEEIQDDNHYFDVVNGEETKEAQLTQNGAITVLEIFDTFNKVSLPNNMTDKTQIAKEIDKVKAPYDTDIKALGYEDLIIEDAIYNIDDLTQYGVETPAQVIINGTMKVGNDMSYIVVTKQIDGKIVYNKSSNKRKPKDDGGLVELPDDPMARGLDFEYIDLPKNEVTPSDWAKDDVYDLTYKGIVNGYEDMTYRPNNNIRRDEFSKLAYMVLELKENTEVEAKEFEDTVNNWAKEMIRVASTNDIVRGYDDVTFGPEDNITNEQMMAILVRGIKYLGKDVRVTNEAEIEKELAKVVDGDNVSNWARSDAATAIKLGLFIGDENKAVKPTGYTTRAQVAVILERYLKVIEEIKK